MGFVPHVVQVDFIWLKFILTSEAGRFHVFIQNLTYIPIVLVPKKKHGQEHILMLVMQEAL